MTQPNYQTCPVCLTPEAILLIGDVPEFSTRKERTAYKNLVLNKPFIEAIISSELAAHGVEREVMMSRDRSKQAVEARRACAVRLQEELHLGPTDIGIVLRRDHASVIQMLRREGKWVRAKGKPRTGTTRRLEKTA